MASISETFNDLKTRGQMAFMPATLRTDQKADRHGETEAHEDFLIGQFQHLRRSTHDLRALRDMARRSA